MILLAIDITIQDVLIGVLTLAITIIGFFLVQYFNQQKDIFKEHGEKLTCLDRKIGTLTTSVKVIEEGFNWMKSNCNERHEKIKEFVRIENNKKRK